MGEFINQTGFEEVLWQTVGSGNISKGKFPYKSESWIQSLPPPPPRAYFGNHMGEPYLKFVKEWGADFKVGRAHDYCGSQPGIREFYSDVLSACPCFYTDRS